MHRRHAAVLTGYDSARSIVYSEEITLDEYDEGTHVWDSSADILRLRLVRLIGELFDGDGQVYQEFESRFSPTTGMRVGGRVKHNDGQEFRDGVMPDS